MIYFNDKKEAFGYFIPDYICSIEDSFWLNFSGLPCGYAWDIINGEFKDLRETENYKKYLEDKEKERINLLSMTKREMFLGLYQAKGITPDIIKEQITDPKALIEFEYANEYFRGNPLIDEIGAKLGFETKQLDKFFETKDYTYLLPSEQVKDETEQAIEQVSE